MMALRFKDKVVHLRDFLDEVWVRCPECAKCAVIRDIFGESPTATLYCEYCGLHKSHNRVFYDLVLDRYCPHCRERFVLRREEVRQKKEVVCVACPHCHTMENYYPTYQCYNVRHIDMRGEDNFFFYTSLWLRKPFKNELFFAYNPQHLAYLKSFIAADIRERNDYSYRMWTHTTTLPAFIKSRKNRVALLRVIRQLQEKAKSS